MSKRKKSPCVDVCIYQGVKGWCIACYMTCKESNDWKSMKPYDRNILLKNLSKRHAIAVQEKAKLQFEECEESN